MLNKNSGIALTKEQWLALAERVSIAATEIDKAMKRVSSVWGKEASAEYLTDIQCAVTAIVHVAENSAEQVRFVSEGEVSG